MIAGMGIDICSLEQVSDLLKDSPKQALLEIFTPSELERGKERGSGEVEHLAGVFAAKEAVFKAFSIDWDSGVSLNEVEVHLEESGQPLVVLSGRFAELLDQGKLLVTISHDAGVAVAAAVLDR